MSALWQIRGQNCYSETQQADLTDQTQLSCHSNKRFIILLLYRIHFLKLNRHGLVIFRRVSWLYGNRLLFRMQYLAMMAWQLFCWLYVEQIVCKRILTRKCFGWNKSMSINLNIRSLMWFSFPGVALSYMEFNTCILYTTVCSVHG